MPVRPTFQERHHDYVLGPNQDARLANVAAGAVIEKVTLTLDTDAPFVLRSRALRQKYTAALRQNGLQFVATRWTGPNRDYRQQDFVLESLQMANFGQCGNPGPVCPSITYPAAGNILIDVYNTGSAAITNLTFYFRGVKLFPHRLRHTFCTDYLTVYPGNRGAHCVCGATYDLAVHQDKINALVLPASWQLTEETG